MDQLNAAFLHVFQRQIQALFRQFQGAFQAFPAGYITYLYTVLPVHTVYHLFHFFITLNKTLLCYKQQMWIC